jgi:hypothetical protein
MTQAELQHHIQLLLDREISADEFAELETELLENPEALETYRAYANLHCALQKHCDIQQLIKNQPVVPIDRVLALQRKFVVKVSLLGAAAIMLLSAVTMFYLQGPDRQLPLAKFQIAPGSDFTLTHEGEGEAPVGNTMVEGSRIVLRHGVAELNLPHDIRAVIEAPAEMVLRDDRTLAVNYGRGLFQVNSMDGRGFTVATPRQRIVDLGTAFGIDFPKGSTEIELHVLEGRVRVDSKEGAPGEIDVNNNMTAGGWDTSLMLDLDDSTALIKLTSMVVDLRLTNNAGAPQTSGKSSRVIVELVGSISGSLGKLDPGNSPSPSDPYTRTLDLTSLPTLDGSETYTLLLKARGTSHNKSLKAIELKGNIAAVSASTPFNDPIQ